MSLRLPGDEAATEEDSVAGGRASGVGVARPVSVGVHNELHRSRARNDKTEVKSSLKVAEDPLGNNKVVFPRIMHVQAELLNSVHDVRPSEGQILKCTRKAAVCCRISNGRTSSSGDLSTSINRGGAWLAVAHAMASENVQGVLSL